MTTKITIAKKLSRCVLFLFFSAFTSLNAQTTWTDLMYNENQANIEYNPLKGFVNSNNNNQTNFPTSVQFSYFGLNQVFTNWDTYDWAPVETKINEALNSGSQFVMRFYIDYPDKKASIYALPSFLSSLVTSYPYSDPGSGLGSSPDYNDPDLILALEQFIAAFGAKYNNDPRIAFVDVGLVGRWGEWNYTSVANGVPLESQIDQTNGDKINQAFKNAFPNKKITARDPIKMATSLRTSFGYHDDSFGKTTLRPELSKGGYLARLVETGLLENWKTQINGGEVHPDLPVDAMYATWPYIYVNTEFNYECNLVDAINQTHATWMRDNSIFTTNTPYNKTNALRASKLLGYQLYARSVKLTPNTNGTVGIELQMQNKGVAPFYYDWNIEFAAKNTCTGTVTTLGTANWNISGIIENSVDYLKTATTNAIATSGIYKILMRVVNPVETVPGGSNMKPLRFANSTQDADQTGWLTLGTATIGSGDNGGANCVGDVKPNVIELTSWVSGTTNAKVPGSDRLLVVMVMGESSGAFSATSVSYGGQVMTKQTERVEGTGFRTYSSIFTLNEAGVNNAEASGSIEVSFDGVVPSATSFDVYSILLSNVNQTTSVGSPISAGIFSGVTVETAALPSATGDMIIFSGATANNNITTIENGFTKVFESNKTWGDGLGGSKLSTGVEETPKFTQSLGGRMALCALVVKKASDTKLSVDEKLLANSVKVYPNPVSNILNINSEGSSENVITVFNALGQIVYSTKSNSTNTQIDMQQLNVSGFVIVQVIADGKVSNHKVIVK